MKRPALPRALLGALLLLLATACTTVCDVHITGGMVVDGTGAPPRRADVLVTDGRITAVGTPGKVIATRTIDATGKVVTPGFIDAHAHGDVRRTPGFPSFVAMGVTTVCLGQDGVSPGGRPFAAWLAVATKGRPRCNVAPFVGHGTLRNLAGIGMSATPTSAELAQLAQLTEAALTAGAFGVSMGLEYEPGRFATPDELARVFEVVTAHSGLVMAHIRSEDDDRIEAALLEFVSACPADGHAHIAHLKVVYGSGADRADAVLGCLAKLRTGSRRVTADVYPYLASYTGIGIVFPHWAKPPHDYAAVVDARRDELAAFLRQRIAQRNGPDAMLLGSGQHAGKTLAEVAAAAGRPFEELLIDLGPSAAGAAHFVMDHTVMERLLLADHVMISSDGSPTMRHPRGHGAFARVLREFVVERGLLSLEQAVHKMTGLTAVTIGLDDRGVIAPGMVADLLVFDPAEVRDHATYAQPFARAEGIDTVLIAGELVREDGEFTMARPGRVLLRR